MCYEIRIIEILILFIIINYRNTYNIVMQFTYGIVSSIQHRII